MSNNICPWSVVRCPLFGAAAPQRRHGAGPSALGPAPLALDLSDRLKLAAEPVANGFDHQKAATRAPVREHLQRTTDH